MIYQIVSPVVQTINGDSLKDAIKNFVKINDMYSLNKLIVTDQQNAYYNEFKTTPEQVIKRKEYYHNVIKPRQVLKKLQSETIII